MDLQQRDSSYHRRLTVISTVVVIAVALVVIAGQRYVHRDDSNMVGWRGDMELLPELTIEPDVALPEAAPAPRKPERKENVAATVAATSEFETAPRVDTQVPRPTEPDVLDLEARGTARSEATHLSGPVSYSNTYVILRTVKPRYPEAERLRAIEGSVTVELLVDVQGLVARANVLNLVGPASFEQSALEAVRQFEFQPPIENGEPTTMWIKFVIKFRMNN